jgi:hypothetical protein
MAAMAVALAVPAAAQAIVIVGTLDQQQTSTANSKWFPDSDVLAQTFTAGATGTLNTVTFNLGTLPNVAVPAAAGDFAVQIWPTSSNAPTGGSPLASEAVTYGGGGLYAITFTTPASVASGTLYAIELVPQTGTILDWLGQCQTDNYASGQALVFDTANDPQWRSVIYWGNVNDADACQLDFAFATYVTAPNTTPPPTATSQAPAGENRGSALPLLLVTLAIAASALTVKRLATTGR